MDAEHIERKAANPTWMKQALAEATASNSLGLVLRTQANPGFENFWPSAAKTRYFCAHWVRISIDPDDPQLFRFKAEIVRENVVNRRD